MALVTVPKVLREQLTEEGADELILLINNSQNEQKEEIIEIVEERFISRLTLEISGLRSEFKQDISGLRSEFKQDFAALQNEFKQDFAGMRSEFKADLAELDNKLSKEIFASHNSLKSELKADIADSRTTMIKWMFIFWVSQIGIIIGILALFLK